MNFLTRLKTYVKNLIQLTEQFLKNEQSEQLEIPSESSQTDIKDKELDEVINKLIKANNLRKDLIEKIDEAIEEDYADGAIICMADNEGRYIWTELNIAPIDLLWISQDMSRWAQDTVLDQ